MGKKSFWRNLCLAPLLFFACQVYGQTITITSLSDNGPYCPGDAFTIDYTVSSLFPLFNTFTAQLSNSTGSFASPVTIGSHSSLTSGTINVAIPTNSVNGSQYRIRIVSNYGSVSATSAALIINVPSISTQPSTATQSICVGASGTALTVAGSTTAGTITGYQWYSNTTASNSGGTLIAGATSASYTPTSATAGVRYYYATATSSIGCTSAASSVSGAITFNAIPTISTTTGGSVCVSGTATLGATASAGTINWYTALSGGTSLGTGTSFVTPTLNATTTYYVDATSNGCTTASRTAVTATIHSLPVISSVADVAPTLCPSLNNGSIKINASGSNLEYSINNGTSYQASNTFNGLSNGTYTIRVRNSAVASCFVNHTSTVTFNASCLASGKCYDILSYNSSKIIEVVNNSLTPGADIVQRPYTQGPHQQWRLTQVGAYYRIDNVNSGLSAEVAGGTTAQGTHITQNTYIGANYQQWTIANVSGLYTITNRQTGLLMDIEGAVTTDGTFLIQWPANNQNNQRWNMTEVACQLPCSTVVNSTITAGATSTCINTPVSVSVPDGGANVSYAWTGTGLSSTTIRNPTITVATAGTYAYTVTATHTNGCKSTSSINITFNNFTPTVSLASTATAICSGTSVTFTATANNLGGGTATYNFKNNGVSVQSGTSNTYTTTGLTNGNAITVDISVTGGSCLTSTTASSNTVNMSVTTRPSATISYAGTPFCRSLATAQAVTRTGTTGGTYSSTAGLTINASTGDITPSTSTAGTYTVTYSMAATGNCPIQTATTSVTVTAVPATPTISYTGTPFCSTVSSAPVTQGGVTGGTFSAGAGLTINASTGTITPSTSAGGTYTVTYSYSGGGCSATANTSVTITTLPAATISYAGTPFCKSLATAQAVTRTGTAGGSYSSTAGLTINASTGEITPSTSTAGTYTVTYTMAAGGGCTQQTATTSVTITTVPTTPTISYAGSPFCTNAGIGNVTQAGVTGGTYSAGAGLTINASTGAITPSTSTAGTYTVTYSYSGGGCSATANTSVTITTLPVATISYAGTPFCKSLATAQAVTRTGTAGGAYSSTAGLTINASTGDITPSTSTAGTYTVTYTLAATGGCAQQTATASVTITTLPAATISYAGSPFCSSITTAQAVTRTGTAGGSYSAPAGLSIDAATGDITPSTSTAGTYTVTYTLAATGGCAQQTATTSVTITTLPVATISYAGSPFCSSLATAQAVTRTGTAGGAYSSTAGLTLNASTGAITPSTSTAGTYTVTYTLAATGGCAQQTATASVTITTLPAATISYAGTPFCTSEASAPVTRTGSAGGTYSAPVGLTINASTGEITPNTSTAGTYTVTYTLAATGGCAQQTATTSVTITTLPVATIAYNTSPFCGNVVTGQVVTRTGTAGGSYSAPAGLTINSTSGTITPNTSTPGTYTVTYTLATTGGCSAQTATTSVTVTPVPSATISYVGAPFCSSDASVHSVTVTGTTGGTFSSTAGLSINASNGDIVASTSTPGTYTVVYTIAAAGGCGVRTFNTSVTITTIPSATISYVGNTFCITNTALQAVTRTGTSGGTYSATPAGLAINASSGQIRPSTSTGGTYIVTYTIPATGGCSQQTATTSVTIQPLASITVQPVASTTICSGGNATFSVSATGGGTLSYQWRRYGIDISDDTVYAGTNTPTLTLTGATLAHQGDYSVVVSGTCGGTPVISSNANLIINTPPNITSQPFFQTICEGGAITFEVVAYGGDLNYQWRVDGANISNGGIYGGVNTSVLTLNGADVSYDGKMYSVVVSNGCVPNATSTSALLTVVPYVTPEVSISVNANDICAGTTVAFTAVPGGGGASPSYQWKVNGSNVGTNVNPYNTSTLNNGDVVSVVMTSNGQCLTTPTAVSNNVTMIVKPGIVNNLVGNDETLCYGLIPSALVPTATMSGGTGTYTYQWQSSTDNVTFTDIGGATSSGYAPGAITVNTWYRRLVSSGACNSASNSVHKLINTGSFIWIGNTSTDWNTASNWCNNAIPTATDDVTINAGTLNSPVVGPFTAYSNNLNLTPSAKLTLNNDAVLEIRGHWVNAGYVIPEDGSTVRFTANSGTQTISGGSTPHLFFNLEKTAASTLQITASSGVVIRRGGLLKVAAGTFDLNNKVVLLKSKVSSTYVDSTASLGVVTGTIINAANFKVERYNTAKRGFRYVAAPVLGITGNTFKDSVVIAGPQAGGFDPPYNPVATIKGFAENRAADWTKCFFSFTNINTPIVPGKGYYLYVPAKRTTIFPANEPVTLLMTGPPKIGTVHFNVIYTPSASQGWNLVGNPYPSAIDWDHPSAWTKTNMNDAIYIWDPNIGAGGAYYSYLSGVSSDGRDNGSVISSGQGFFVRGQLSPALSVTENAKVVGSYSTANFRRAPISYVTLKITNSVGDVDYTTVRINDGSGKDQDALKLFNPKLNMYTTGINSTEQFSINAIDDMPAFEVPLYISSSNAANCQIEVIRLQGAIGDGLKIKDFASGSVWNLSQGLKFSLTVTGTQRLALIKSADDTSLSRRGAATGVDVYPSVATETQPVVYSNGNMHKKIEIIKASGEKLATYETFDAAYSLKDFEGLAAGIYTVKVSSVLGIETFKVVK